jgi:hypothetical protein
MRFVLLILIDVLVSSWANAHPTSYKGAVGVMSYNTPKMNEVLLTYSVEHNFAVAVTYLKDSKSEFYIPRLNFLAKRWNNDSSQGNLYLSGGSGFERFNSENYSVRFAEVVADWESREYYVYLDHTYLNRDNEINPALVQKDYNHSKFRVGTAPFLADYEDLNVWLILQAEKHLDEEQIQMTQFLRFYKKNTLWEIGASLNGGWAFNYMIHF